MEALRKEVLQHMGDEEAQLKIEKRGANTDMWKEMLTRLKRELKSDEEMRTL